MSDAVAGVAAGGEEEAEGGAAAEEQRERLKRRWRAEVRKHETDGVQRLL